MVITNGTEKPPPDAERGPAKGPAQSGYDDQLGSHDTTGGTARLLIGDVFARLGDIPDGSIQSVITSPPYLAKRAYLPEDDPAKALEIGTEPTPAEFIGSLLRVMDALWPKLSDDGTLWVNLGDTASGSGGAGGDYGEGGWREGQSRYSQDLNGKAQRTRSTRGTGARGEGWPLPKSVCWIPELFGASLAYGRNLLTGEPCRRWVTRPPITWCKPSPTPGKIFDKFREATELFVFAAKQQQYYFDLDAVREPPKGGREPGEPVGSSAFVGHPRSNVHDGRPNCVANEKGAPPLNWWVVNSSGYDGAHYATFPPELIRRPVIVSCPPGGTILDPFCGSGTTLMVATGHGRHAVGIDLDARNADFVRQRLGMFLDVAEPSGAAA